ncbi:ABC transporter substrate-binding protein [Pseudoruegeria sp. SK021]|uniref:ABC transporter substrate-binding protein n=1 Tax=Pseudoruegeria sp. SK021 TaxID=1933035 RepID=UPI000A235F0E|nr:ABC transporter substrate-binding protein [Pseudoruegeria sp. SK021]OSP54783.1 ABC transporter substrate-binding protein [Pseudoruegeria sp. SK021]
MKTPISTTSLMMPRRSFLMGSAAVAGTTLAAPSIGRAQTQELYINSWGGAWLEAATENLFDPFTKDTGIAIKTVSPVSFAKLAAQVRSGVYEFDVTTLGGGDIIRANQAGLLEDLAPTYEGGVYENGMGSHAFATVLAWRTDAYPDAGPQSWADFWDVERFPGNRSLQRYPARIIPLALLADGVAVEDLYPLDFERAFAKLDQIKDHITVWWTADAQSEQLLRDGEVDMIGIWHGSYFRAEDSGAPVAMTWNQAEIERSYWVVAKDTPNMEAAKLFVDFATSAAPLAGFVEQANYGALNPAATALVPDTAQSRMPTSTANYPLAFEQDMANWGADPEEVSMRFEEWLSY